MGKSTKIHPANLPHHSHPSSKKSTASRSSPPLTHHEQEEAYQDYLIFQRSTTRGGEVEDSPVSDYATLEEEEGGREKAYYLECQSSEDEGEVVQGGGKGKKVSGGGKEHGGDGQGRGRSRHPRFLWRSTLPASLVRTFDEEHKRILGEPLPRLTSGRSGRVIENGGRSRATSKDGKRWSRALDLSRL